MTVLKVPLNQSIKGIHSFKEIPTLADSYSDMMSGYPEDLDQEEYQYGAKRLVNHLRNQVKVLEAALQNAREDSYKAGYEEARFIVERRFREDISGLQATYEQMVESLKIKYDEALNTLGKPLAQFSLQIAEKILGRTLSEEEAQNEFLVTQLHRFLKDVAKQSKFKIKVNPRQLTWISSEQNLLKKLPHGSQLSFVPDEDLKPGECIVETDTEVIQGLMQEYLSFINQNLFEGEAC